MWKVSFRYRLLVAPGQSYNINASISTLKYETQLWLSAKFYLDSSCFLSHLLDWDSSRRWLTAVRSTGSSLGQKRPWRRSVTSTWRISRWRIGWNMNVSMFVKTSIQVLRHYRRGECLDTKNEMNIIPKIWKYKFTSQQQILANWFFLFDYSLSLWLNRQD